MQYARSAGQRWRMWGALALVTVIAGCTGGQGEPGAQDASEDAHDAGGAQPDAQHGEDGGIAVDAAPEVDAFVPPCTLMPDVDGDGDGVRAIACGGDDCDDTDPRRYPGNVEVCDGANHDEDCDPTTFGYRDVDMDGFPDATCCNIDSGSGAMRCGSDCNDLIGIVHPTEAESCDGLDNDCNGVIDEGVLNVYYVDGDGDHYGNASAATMRACRLPDGYADRPGDCDDIRASRNPAAPEACDGLDNDCDGRFAHAMEDDDGDGFADGDPLDDHCGGNDCNDREPSIHPGATERCDDVDSDCSGTHEDHDDDGFLAVGETCAGGDPDLASLPRTDCDDTNRDTYVGAVEQCDARDNDCDGTADDGADATCLVRGGAGRCETGGHCAFAACLPHFADCDHDTSNGCDDLQSSGLHCGRCGNRCAYACNAAGGCDDVATLALSYSRMCVVTQGGQVFCAGEQFRDHGTRPYYNPDTPYFTRVPIDSVVDVALGDETACARKGDGTVWCWGGVNLGTGTEGSLTPVQVPGITHATGIAMDDHNASTCVAQSTGQTCCWGYLTNGLFGPGTIRTSTPRCTATPWVSIVHEAAVTCGLSAEGAPTCVADPLRRTPTFPAGSYQWLSDRHCALRSDGHVICLEDRYVDGVAVHDLGIATSVEEGQDRVCMRRSDGRIDCYETLHYTDLVAPFGITNAVRVWGGTFGLCYVDTAHTLRCQDGNHNGEFGDGTTGLRHEMREIVVR